MVQLQACFCLTFIVLLQSSFKCIEGLLFFLRVYLQHKLHATPRNRLIYWTIPRVILLQWTLSATTKLNLNFFFFFFIIHSLRAHRPIGMRPAGTVFVFQQRQSQNMANNVAEGRGAARSADPVSLTVWRGAEERQQAAVAEMDSHLWITAQPPAAHTSESQLNLQSSISETWDD